MVVAWVAILFLTVNGREMPLQSKEHYATTNECRVGIEKVLTAMKELEAKQPQGTTDPNSIKLISAWCAVQQDGLSVTPDKAAENL